MVVCSQLQSPDLLRIHARWQPGKDGTDVATFQSLLERPQAIAVARRRLRTRADDEKMIQVDAELAHGAGVQVQWRIEQHDDVFGLRRGQRRREETQLADAWPGKKDFGQPSAWPAVTGQLGVQRRRRRDVDPAAELMSQPQIGVQLFWA